MRRVFTRRLRCGRTSGLDRASSAGRPALVMNEHLRALRPYCGVDPWDRRADRYAELDVIPPLESCVLRGHAPNRSAQVPRAEPGICGLQDWHDHRWSSRDHADCGPRWISPASSVAPWRRWRPSMRSTREYGVTVAAAQAASRAVLPQTRVSCRLRELVPLTDGSDRVRPRVLGQISRSTTTRLPAPERAVVGRLVEGVPTYRVDFAYPHARVIVEYDGEEFHTQAREEGGDREAPRVAPSSMAGRSSS